MKIETRVCPFEGHLAIGVKALKCRTMMGSVNSTFQNNFIEIHEEVSRYFIGLNDFLCCECQCAGVEVEILH